MNRFFIFLFGLMGLYFCFVLSSREAFGGSKFSIHVGKTLRTDHAEHWGDEGKKENLAKINLGLTYKTNFTDRLIDFNIRTEVTSYQWNPDKRLVKLSLLPFIILPSADSLFPFYLGLGGGFGTFFNQVYDESHFTLDYQMLVGFRLVNLLDRLGIFVELSKKNHFFFMDKGKYRGLYLSLGMFFGL